MLVLADQLECLGHARQHSQGQNIHLHEFQRLDIILVPFDNLPVFHGGWLNRHQIVEPVMGKGKTTRMLAEMTWCAHQLLRQAKRLDQTIVIGIEAELANIAVADLFRP